MTDILYTRAHIRESLSHRPSAPDEDMLWLPGASPEVVERIRTSMPPTRIPAAVLVPLVEREEGMTVLLTQRAATLKDHAGQISFPGGRIEPDDVDPWRAALREAHEEIGLSPDFVEFAGFLPDHWVGTVFGLRPSWASSIRGRNCASPRERCTTCSKCLCNSFWIPRTTNRARAS